MSAPAGNLSALLFDHPAPPDQDLLCTVSEAVTAGAARAAADELAATLRRAGLLPGQAVGVRLPNGPEAVIAMAAVWRAGGVLVPLNPRSSDAESAHAVAATGPAAMVTPAGVERAGGDRRYEDGDAFITWTSGTTGVPKPIVHTHTGYLELLDRVLGPLRGAGSSGRPPSPNLIPVSLALNAGIYNALFGLRAGAPLVIMDGFDPATFATLVRRFDIRSTVLPPAAIAMLADDPAVGDLAPLRYVRSITAPLSPLQARRFSDRFGVFVLNGYGQAEMGEVIGWTAADARAHPDKLGAVGRPHPGVAIRVDHDGDAGPGAVGELLVRPPTLAAGYASGDDLGDRIDPDGYVRTGDLARVDEDGFVWIEGRLGDLINRGGNKVFPEQVEEVLRLHPAVTDAAVVGLPDERLGQVPVAFVVADPAPAPDELEALCREHLTPYKVPVTFEVVAALPRTEAGKLRRRALAEQGWAGVRR